MIFFRLKVIWIIGWFT